MLKNKNTDTSGFYHDKCGGYDYLIAVTCGAIAGIIDILFVENSKDSKLGKWTDDKTDNLVKRFAKLTGWNPREGKEESIGSAIGFLEKKFKVNYDQRYTSDIEGIFNMSTKNHHLKSLSHSPDIVGLIFSVLDQFLSTSSFADDGKLIVIRNKETFELEGNNFITKLFCGITNWFGHIMSDIAGSSGGRGSIKGGRGSGVAIPFFEMFQFCKFGSFKVGDDKQDLATLATRVFQEGYDARYGATMAIPVILNELLIRLIWSLKHYFYHKKPIKECIPTMKHDDLRVMLIFGQGTLCIMDGADAAIRSGGNWLLFFMRLNIIGWFRFVSLVLKEVYIRTDIVMQIKFQADAYKQINNQLSFYLYELEAIDIESWKQEVESLKNINLQLEQVTTNQELNKILYKEMEYINVKLPFKNHDESIDFMNDKDTKLIF